MYLLISSVGTNARIIAATMIIGFICIAAINSGKYAADDHNGNYMIEYSHGGEMDIYSDGNTYGHKMTIDFEGKLIIYERIYRQYNKEEYIDNKKIKESTLDTAQLDSLITLIRNPDFTSLSGRLPNVDPREVEIREPAASIEIKYKTDPDAQATNIRANMGADNRHYPDAFLEFNRELRSLLRSQLE